MPVIARGPPSARPPRVPWSGRCGGPGGAGGMVVMPGGVSGQTSRTGQGAWSTTKRVAGLRLRGPRRVRSPSRARMSRSAPSATATTSRSIRPDRSSRVQGRPEALGGGLEELLSGRGGQLLQAGAGVALGAAAAEQARVGAVGGTGDVAAGDVEQDDIGAFGRVGAGGVDAGRPGAFDDPGDHGHGNQPPMACSEAHSASTARIRAAGTVSSPSRVNSPRSTSVSCSRTMRRHSRVARDPA